MQSVLDTEEREERNMVEFKQRQLKDLVSYGYAWDISDAQESDYWAIRHNEGNIEKIGYSCGKYECNGLLLRGSKTGQLYAITKRTKAIYLFG